MRNKELVIKKVEQVEGKIRLIKSMASNPAFTLEQLNKVLTEQEELLQEIKDFIGREVNVY